MSKTLRGATKAQRRHAKEFRTVRKSARPAFVPAEVAER